MCSGLVLHDEKLDSGIWLLNPVTMALECHSLLKAMLLKNSLFMWCHEMVGADMDVIVVVCRSLS